MKSALFEIPDEFVSQAVGYSGPYRARVSYEVFNGQVGIMEIAMSPDALRRVTKSPELVDQIANDLKISELGEEEHKPNRHLPEVMQEAINAHLKY